MEGEIGPRTVPASLVVSLLAATKWTRLVMRGTREDEVKMKSGSLTYYISHVEKQAYSSWLESSPMSSRLKRGERWKVGKRRAISTRDHLLNGPECLELNAWGDWAARQQPELVAPCPVRPYTRTASRRHATPRHAPNKDEVRGCLLSNS